jgi:hypothetical protein
LLAVDDLNRVGPADLVDAGVDVDDRADEVAGDVFVPGADDVIPELEAQLYVRW